MQNKITIWMAPSKEVFNHLLDTAHALKGSVMVVYLVAVDFHSKSAVNSQSWSGGAQYFHEFAKKIQYYRK